MGKICEPKDNICVIDIMFYNRASLNEAMEAAARVAKLLKCAVRFRHSDIDGIVDVKIDGRMDI